MAKTPIVGIQPVHLSHRANWLRAAVLGATDGILSVSSLLLGVTASGASANMITTVGVAALVAGASSMAAGEYVSVSSQRDSERADLLIEKEGLDGDPSGELTELMGIYERRGLPKGLAREVAVALSGQGVLEAHARDELGLDKKRRARPMQAAATSAISFASGAALPLIAVSAVPAASRTAICVVVTLFTLALLGDVGARLGWSPKTTCDDPSAHLGNLGYGTYIRDRCINR
jgi:vacuolar iron transporter family protein